MYASDYFRGLPGISHLSLAWNIQDVFIWLVSFINSRNRLNQIFEFVVLKLPYHLIGQPFFHLSPFHLIFLRIQHISTVTFMFPLVSVTFRFLSQIRFQMLLNEFSCMLFSSANQILEFMGSYIPFLFTSIPSYIFVIFFLNPAHFNRSFLINQLPSLHSLWYR